MKNYLLLGFLLLCFSCNITVNKKASKADLAFEKLSEEYIKGYLDWRPEAAVYLGIHEYDGKSSDFIK